MPVRRRPGARPDQTPASSPPSGLKPLFLSSKPFPFCIKPCKSPQSALGKERRELQVQQQRTLLEAIPRDLSRPWEDPMPEEVRL